MISIQPYPGSTLCYTFHAFVFSNLSFVSISKRAVCLYSLVSFREVWSLFQLFLFKYVLKTLMIINYLSHKPFFVLSTTCSRVVECSCWCVISNSPRVSISVCYIRSSHLGVSGSLSAASCVTNRFTTL